MNKIYILALLVVIASANIAADITNIASAREILSCLASQNVSRVILEISDENGAVNKDFLKGFIFAKDAGIATVDAIAIVNDNFTTAELSAEVTAALPGSFNGTVWLRVLDSPKLWSQPMKVRVSYLESLIATFEQGGVKVGVYSDANTWASVFGSQGTGSDFLKGSPVWYVNENNAANFKDFSYAGFGTWTKPTLKNYLGNIFTCYSVVASFNFF